MRWSILLLVFGLTLSLAPTVLGQMDGVELHNTLMPASSGMGGASFTQPQDLQSEIYGNPATMTPFEGDRCGCRNRCGCRTQAAFSGAWAERASDFRLIAQGQFWLPLMIQGPVKIGNTSTDVHVDLGELLDSLQGLFEGGLELTNDERSFDVWSVYFNLGDDARTTTRFGTRDTDVKFKATLVDMAAMYRIGERSLGRRETAKVGMDLLAGMIVYELDLEVDTIGPFGVDLGLARDESWVDFTVGGRLEFEFSDRFSTSLRGEVGGFGIGSSSKLVWNTTLLAEYKLYPKVGKHRLIKHHKSHCVDCRCPRRLCSLVAGFRYFDVDWEKGSGRDRIGYDWQIYGPIVGVNIYF